MEYINIYIFLLLEGAGNTAHLVDTQFKNTDIYTENRSQYRPLIFAAAIIMRIIRHTPL